MTMIITTLASALIAGSFAPTEMLPRQSLDLRVVQARSLSIFFQSIVRSVTAPIREADLIVSMTKMKTATSENGSAGH